MVSGTKFGSKSGKNMLEDFKFRYNKIEPPDVYLGATLAKMKVYSAKVTYIDQRG